MHEIAPVTNRGRNDEAGRSSLAELTSKWAGLWRSLILSSIGQTLYPYCHYSRALDLTDLGYLFEDPQFDANLMKSFFADMKAIVDNPPRRTKRGWKFKDAVQSIGTALVSKSPLIEELDGNLDAHVLQAWIPQLRKLRRLQLWQGAALEGLGQIVQAECPNFNSCEFYHWNEAGDDADEPLAIFLTDLKKQSLQSFQFVGRSQIGAQTMLALSENHGSSLTELILIDMPSEAVSDLGLLKKCTSLQGLAISEQSRTTDLKRTHQGVFEEVVDWLRGCKNLKRLKFTNFLSGASILSPLFAENSLHLEELELSSYTQESAPAFYESMQSQAETLRELLLQSETEEDPLKIDELVQGVCKLRRLRILHLRKISDFFRDEHIVNIASSLRQLEELWLSGWGVTDMVFGALSGLHSLRRAEITAISEFTFDGIVDYVSQLGPGNQELLLSVSMANPQFALSEDEQAMIKNMILEKVNGRFDYNTSRDLDAEESDESDSD